MSRVQSKITQHMKSQEMVDISDKNFKAAIMTMPIK